MVVRLTACSEELLRCHHARELFIVAARMMMMMMQGAPGSDKLLLEQDAWKV